MPAAASDPKTIAHEAPKRMTGAKSDTLSNARSLLSVIKASLEAHPDERDDGWEWGCVVMIESVQDLIAHEEIRPDQSAPQDVEPEQHRESSQFEAIKREAIRAAEDLMSDEQYRGANDSRIFTAVAAHSIIEGAIMLGVDAVSGASAPRGIEPEQHRESSQFEVIKREAIGAAEDLMAEEDSRIFTAEAAHSIIEGAIMLGVDAVSRPPASHILRKRLIRA